MPPSDLRFDLEAALDSNPTLSLHCRMSKMADLSPRKRAERVAREERLAQALRENLHRRKEQARAQAERTVKPNSAGNGLSDAPLSSKTNRHGGTTAD